jgi:hypothetical protein
VREQQEVLCRLQWIMIVHSSIIKSAVVLLTLTRIVAVHLFADHTPAGSDQRATTAGIMLLQCRLLCGRTLRTARPTGAPRRAAPAGRSLAHGRALAAAAWRPHPDDVERLSRGEGAKRRGTGERARGTVGRRDDAATGEEKRPPSCAARAMTLHRRRFAARHPPPPARALRPPGNHHIPHRLSLEERPVFESSKKRGFLAVRGAGARKAHAKHGHPLPNSFRQWADAKGLPCVVIEQDPSGAGLDRVAVDLAPLRLLDASQVGRGRRERGPRQALGGSARMGVGAGNVLAGRLAGALGVI